MDLHETFAAVQAASRQLLTLDDTEINRILLAVADAAIARTDFILEENRKDLERMDAADPKYDRLKLTEERLQGIAADIRNSQFLWFYGYGYRAGGKREPETGSGYGGKYGRYMA